jgi:hypothetical protein
MANPNSPFGFRPIGRLGGGPIGVSEYAKPASDTNYAIFMFDLVGKAASSGLPPTGQGNPAPGCQSAQNLTPGTSLYLGSSINYGAISTLTMHYVTDEIDMVYIAQVDAVTSITAAADAGKNANVLTTAGSATTKQSNMSVNHTGIATTSGLDLRILAVSNLSPNVEGVYAIVEVLIMKHALGQGTAGV